MSTFSNLSFKNTIALQINYFHLIFFGTSSTLTVKGLLKIAKPVSSFIEWSEILRIIMESVQPHGFQLKSSLPLVERNYQVVMSRYDYKHKT